MLSRACVTTLASAERHRVDAVLVCRARDAHSPNSTTFPAFPLTLRKASMYGFISSIVFAG